MLAIPYRAWSQCELERAVRVESGVPWEVKVVGADIKWLVARKSCVVFQVGDGCCVQVQELEMEVMIVLGWLANFTDTAQA
jgi:hypothetical protein